MASASKRLIVVLPLVVCIGWVSAFDYSDIGLDWTGLCKTGANQTPINVVRKNAVKVDGYNISISYQTSNNFTLVNTGTNVNIKPQAGTNNTVTFNGVVYNLLQGHAHSVSEHSFDGFLTPLEVHLVHTKATNASELLVLGVLLRLDSNDKNNTFLDTWLSSAPTKVNQSVVVSRQLSFTTDVVDKGKTLFYTYPGSLTIPSCGEGVTWLLVDPVYSPTVSVAQWDLYRVIISLTSNGDPDNDRPTQPLNGRVVKRFEAKPLKGK